MASKCLVAAAAANQGPELMTTPLPYRTLHSRTSWSAQTADDLFCCSQDWHSREEWTSQPNPLNAPPLEEAGPAALQLDSALPRNHSRAITQYRIHTIKPPCVRRKSLNFVVCDLLHAQEPGPRSLAGWVRRPPWLPEPRCGSQPCLNLLWSSMPAEAERFTGKDWRSRHPPS